MSEDKGNRNEKLEERNNIGYYKSFMRFTYKLVHYLIGYWKEILDEYHLNNTEFIILGIVVDHPRVLQQEIVEMVGADKSIVSRYIKKLAEKKLVERRPNPEYHHAYFCEATSLGEKIYRQVHEKGDPKIEEAFSGVSIQEVEQMRDILMKIWGEIYR